MATACCHVTLRSHVHASQSSNRTAPMMSSSAICCPRGLSADVAWMSKALAGATWHLERTQRRTSSRLVSPMAGMSSNEFKTGVNIELDGAPWRVQEFLHVKPGKGAAFVRTKLKNYITGNTVERTFRAGESLEEASVVKDVKQYTYAEGDQFVFMDMVTYEESRLDRIALGDSLKWLKEGMDCNVLTWRDKVISVEIPITVQLKVTQADPGLKGDTAGSGATKVCTVETGTTVQVPLFVVEGDTILIDTRTGNYMSRV